MRIVRWFYVSTFIILFGCSKNKVPKPPKPVEPTKWEKIAGQYFVYDTLGEFLYEMQIDHIVGQDSLGYEKDSLCFINLDGQFTVTEVQSSLGGTYAGIDPVIQPELHAGLHMPIKDKYGKRWRIIGYNNFWKNDTIQLVFQKCNILYYLEDCTPYFCGDVHYVAVKQH